MTALSEFLFPAPAERSALSIIGWWERRRIAYNVCVGAAGSVTLVASVLTSAIVVGQPLIMPGLVGAGVFGLMANLCYLLGPATEILIQLLWGRRVLPTGPTLYRMGLTFSVGLALFPTLLLTIVWVARAVLYVTGMI